MSCCCLPPDRMKLAVNSKKEIKNRVKMGKRSRWATVIYPLKESKWGCCCLPPNRVKLIVNSKKETNSRVKMGQESRSASVIYQKSQNGTKIIMGCCCLPPDRVKLIVNSKVKMGCCCLPPDRMKLTVNSKKETNSRVKMGKGSRWTSVIYPMKKSKCGLLLFTP